MPIIRPMSELRNKTKEIREICKKVDEPIFLTHNGRGHLVVMSLEHYEKSLERNGLHEKLAEAERYWAKGGKGLSSAQILKNLKVKTRGR
jgi:prevent-host-death family protein